MPNIIGFYEFIIVNAYYISLKSLFTSRLKGNVRQAIDIHEGEKIKGTVLAKGGGGHVRAQPAWDDYEFFECLHSTGRNIGWASPVFFGPR
jgi:hypothetical protein